MLKFITPVLAALIIVVSGCTGESADHSDAMSDADGDHMAANPLVESLEAHRADFVAALSGLSEDQLNYHESEDRWSILEVAEHIVMADRGIAAGVTGMLEAGPNPEAAPDSSVSAEMISGMLSDRSTTFTAPDDFTPTGAYSTADEAIAAFDESHQVMVDAASNGDVDLSQYYGDNPVFGTIDASKWISFSMAHGQRHLDQIQQVKDHEGYPDAGA